MGYTKQNNRKSSMIYLNLGCGHQKRKDCINIDCLEQYHPDLICDITKLTYDPNSIDGIYATDVLEHIPRNLVSPTLKSWYKILKIGGFLIIRLPNIKVISEKYLKGKIDAEEFSRLIYGEQEDNDFSNFHKSGFDKITLTKLLRSIGFIEIKNDIKIDCNINNMVIRFGKVRILR
jgi:hypothetical protein